jgi:6-methylsalicylate decarboxylase
MRRCACTRCRPLVLTRRSLVAGAAALAATGIGAAHAQDAAQGAAWRIDVHHHVSPPTWLSAVKRAKLDNPVLDTWTPEHSLQVMDEAGVQLSVVSPTAPQASFLPADQAAAVSRDADEYVARLRADHPGRFGAFAMLPLPYVDESLKEAAYALDVLHAEGVGVLTSYGDKWLGHPDFDPLWAELNRRRCTVYTHPTSANCCVNLIPQLPDYAIEWGTDTTRAIATLLFGGASQRFPDIQWIFSHGGGALTAFAERFEIQLLGLPGFKDWTRERVDRELRRFHYDTAQVANTVTIEALAKLVPVSQILLGSDYGFRTPLEHVRGLAERFNQADQRAIERDNALRLLPALDHA